MKGEIPECKRCCCCLPLRFGLLVWGYFKMTADAFIITMMSYSLILTVMTIRLHGPDDDIMSWLYEEIIIIVIVLAVFITDFGMTIMFIVGGHKKNVKLIRIFYFISIAMWIFSFLLSVIYAVLVMQNDIYYFWSRSMLGFSFYFLALVVQTYFLILLRSEIIKLQNIGEFRFVNNAAESECTMKCEEIEEGEETGSEDV